MTKRIIAVFCYKRANRLKQCIDALLTNPEFKDMVIVFLSDGFNGNNDRVGVLETRDCIDSIKGFKRVIKHYRDRNLSTGPNFRAGLNFLSTNYGGFVVVENDLIISSNYLCYLLPDFEFYRNYRNVFCVIGYVYLVTQGDYFYDTIVYERFCSYGWAGWSNRFNNIIWEESELDHLRKTSQGFKTRLNREGRDLTRMLKTTHRCHFHLGRTAAGTRSENQLKVIYAVLSKVDNIGFDEESTNTFGLNYLVTPIDDGQKRRFKFCPPDLLHTAL